jgi:hypothetical protein
MNTWKRRAAKTIRGVATAIFIILAAAFSLFVAAVSEERSEYGTIVDIERTEHWHRIAIEMDDARLRHCRITADSVQGIKAGDRIEILFRRYLWGTMPHRVRIVRDHVVI